MEKSACVLPEKRKALLWKPEVKVASSPCSSEEFYLYISFIHVCMYMCIYVYSVCYIIFFKTYSIISWLTASLVAIFKLLPSICGSIPCCWWLGVPEACVYLCVWGAQGLFSLYSEDWRGRVWKWEQPGAYMSRSVCSVNLGNWGMLNIQNTD